MFLGSGSVPCWYSSSQSGEQEFLNIQASLFVSPSHSPSYLPPLPVFPICSADLEPLPFSMETCMFLLESF
ncbi:hypothetical protein H671_5g13802 [Cricetulus griseus]|nr:hypothetical protein H671_5g13802 [Cricetulus griseus]